FTFFSLYRCHSALHSFPTRRSSDLFESLKVDDGAVLVATRVFGEGSAFPFSEFVFLGCQILGNGTVEFRIINCSTDVTAALDFRDRKSTRLNSSHGSISYAVFCLKN